MAFYDSKMDAAQRKIFKNLKVGVTAVVEHINYIVINVAMSCCDIYSMSTVSLMNINLTALDMSDGE